MHGAGQFLGIAGYLVHGHDFATHINGLSKSDGSEKHIMDVIFHRFFRDEGHLLRHIFPARAFDGLAGNGILHKIVLIALCGKVESLHGEPLIRVEEGELLLIVHVASGEIKGGEIGSESFIFLIARLLYSLGFHAQVLVVGKSHGAARVERHSHGLRTGSGCHCEKRCQDSGDE